MPIVTVLLQGFHGRIRLLDGCQLVPVLPHREVLLVVASEPEVREPGDANKWFLHGRDQLLPARCLSRKIIVDAPDTQGIWCPGDVKINVWHVLKEPRLDSLLEGFKVALVHVLGPRDTGPVDAIDAGTGVGIQKQQHPFVDEELNTQ